MIGRVLAAGFVCVGMAAGQAPATFAAPAKAYTFEVVSIRQNNTPIRLQKGVPQSGPTADGYHLENDGLGLALMAAYIPQTGGQAFYAPDQIKGIPDWMNAERYDIEARISDEDRAEWQKPERQKLMLQAMLQAMLVDRCKLVVHRETNEVAMDSLVVAKGGPELKASDPAADHPRGYNLPWGGTLVMDLSHGTMSFYGATMASLATWLGGWAGRPVQDKTGLTGKYDVVLKWAGTAPSEDEQTGAASASDPAPTLRWDLKALGLELKSGKGHVETLVIDHMEKPSEN